MHVGLSQKQFPFADDEDAYGIVPNQPTERSKRGSVILSQAAKKDKDTTIDDDETDSFVSACESPSHQQRLLAEQKLRNKKQKQAERKFEELKKERNTGKLAKGFGDLADLR